MRIKESLTVLVVAGVLLAGCGGDSEAEPDAAPSSPSSSDAPTAESEPAVTTADYEDAHTIYHDLSASLNAAGDAAAAFQDAVKKAAEKDPAGFRDSPRVAAAVATQAEAVATREAAVAELTEHPAMADEELASSYGVFTEKYAVAMAYQDGFNDSYAAFLTTNDACGAVLDMKEVQAPTIKAYAERWLAQHEKIAAPCLAGAEELATSTNEDLVAVGAVYATWIDDRIAAMTLALDGKAAPQQAISRLKRANKAMLRTYEATATFSETLGELMPTDEYDAVDVVFKDRVGESEAADPTASPSPAR